MVMHSNVLSLFLRDVRHAVRTFSHRPTFAAIVVLTLALGIGSSVAIVSVANAVLLRPLPFDDPESLVLVWNRMTAANRPNAPVSGPDFLDYRNQTTMFDGFAAAIAVEGTLTGEARPEQVMVGWSTENLFKLLGEWGGAGADVGRRILPYRAPACGNVTIALVQVEATSMYAIQSRQVEADPERRRRRPRDRRPEGARCPGIGRRGRPRRAHGPPGEPRDQGRDAE